MAQPSLVYLDSCIFIELLQRKDDRRFDACEVIVQKAINDEITIVTSSLAIVETNQLPGHGGAAHDASKKIFEYFQNPYFNVRPVTRQIAEIANEVISQHKSYRIPAIDAIHIATAIAFKVPTIYTYDSTLSRKGAKRGGLLRFNGLIGTPTVQIEKPPDPNKYNLFSDENVE